MFNWSFFKHFFVVARFQPYCHIERRPWQKVVMTLFIDNDIICYLWMITSYAIYRPLYYIDDTYLFWYHWFYHFMIIFENCTLHAYCNVKGIWIFFHMDFFWGKIVKIWDVKCINTVIIKDMQWIIMFLNIGCEIGTHVIGSVFSFLWSNLAALQYHLMVIHHLHLWDLIFYIEI